MSYKEQYKLYLEMIEAYLANCIDIKNPYYSNLKEAMNYSLLAGGKRLRPVLGLATAQLLGGDINMVLPYACSIEMIHTYSLIHDDLPAMDDDDFRRGKPTNHKVFGEAMAILAGDGLLNFAYENMLKAALDLGCDINQVRAISAVSHYAGINGMIGGQVIDMDCEGRLVEEDRLKSMHRLKTGALIKAPIEAAAIICNASFEQIDLLVNFAANLGLAFQIKDDILDVEGNIEAMGKKPGSDAMAEKTTYVTLYGMEKAKLLLDLATEEALSCLGRLDELQCDSWFLKELTIEMSKRDR